MIETLRIILQGALERLTYQIKTDLPPLIAAAAILLVAFLLARLARWLIGRAFKGIAVDQWLRRSGLFASGLPRRLGAPRAVAQTAYWAILIIGCLTALNALGTQTPARIVEGVVFFFPRLLAAGLIVLVGIWLGQYLGRSTLVWAVNEDLPFPRRLALVVRALVVFLAVVVAADTADFARGVFLAAFVLLVGGAVLAASLAVGLGAGQAVRRRLEPGAHAGSDDQGRLAGQSLWNHL